MTVTSIVVYGMFLIIGGYFLPSTRNKKIIRTTAWLMVCVTIVFSVIITANQTALYRMIAIVALQLLSMKVVVYGETSSRDARLNFIQWTAFALGWFGMRPYLFQSLFAKRLPFASLLLKGLSRIVLGFAFIYISFLIDENFKSNYFTAALFLIIGLSFILHFGVLNIATAMWRLLGVDVRELFRSPYKSKSLKEFWGKRWNIAFTEMTAIVAYKPLKKKHGHLFAMTISFLLLGFLHEIAISFPVMACFGLPMLYFAIHAWLMYCEESYEVVKRIVAHPMASHIWVLGWLLIPMPILFHTPFIQHVLIPLREKLLIIARI